MGRFGDLLLGTAQGTMSSLDEQKKQKQALLLELLKSGAYQPSSSPQPKSNFMSRFGENVMGPNLNGSNTNLMGMNLERVTPEIQAAQTAKMMEAYKPLLGNSSTGSNLRPEFQVGPDGRPKVTLKSQDPLISELRKSQIEDRKQKALNNRSDYTDKRLKLLGDDLDPSKYRTGAFGVSKQVFDRGERLQSLKGAIDAFQSGNADSRQIEEIAIGLNAQLSGANVGAQQQVAALVPRSIMGDAKKLYEWLSNDPTGTNQQKFVNRMMGTVDREMSTAKAQMDRTRFERLAKYDSLIRQKPEEAENIMRSYGINPEDYYAWKKGGYKPISAVQGATASTGKVDYKAKYGLE